MAITRANLKTGPGKIYFKSAGYWPVDVIAGGPEATWREASAAMFGRMDDVLNDLIFRVSFTPYALWQNLTVLFPTYCTSPTIETSIFGDADAPASIWGANGDLITLTAAAITKPPSLRLGPDQQLFGSCEITGIIGTGLELSGTTPVYQVAAAQADPGGVFAQTNHLADRWTGVWGAVTGFGAIEPDDYFDVSCELNLSTHKSGGVTRDMRVAGVTWMAKCRPNGPTMAQIEAAMKVQGTGNGVGKLASAGAADLTLTSSGGKSIVLNQAAMRSAGFRIGQNEVRAGEVAWVTTTEFSTGTPAALVTIT